MSAPARSASGTSRHAWLLAVRPRTLGASAIPVLVGSAVAFASGAFSPSVAFVCLLAALLLQVGTNLANDALDFAHGIDSAARIGPTRVTQAGLLSYRQVAGGASLAFALAIACGSYLVAVGGLAILCIGLVAVVAGVAYSGGPFPLSSHGLGELAAFFFFGVVAVAGTTLLHTGALSAAALRASLPIGALVACLMLVNNLRDIESDAAAGKRTLAVRLGAARTRTLYAALIALAGLAPLLPLPGSAPWLSLASLPLAVPLLRELHNARSGPEFNALLAGTARLHGVYGLLLALGISL